jgi:hypothetical protein
MTDLAKIFANIGIDQDYYTMDFTEISEDLPGWASTDRIIDQILQRAKPTTVVEVGTWKGASIMAILYRKLDGGSECSEPILCRARPADEDLGAQMVSSEADLRPGDGRLQGVDNAWSRFRQTLFQANHGSSARRQAL